MDSKIDEYQVESPFTEHHNQEGGRMDSVHETTLSIEHIRLQAEATFARFLHGDGVEYISEAIALDRQALELCPSQPALLILLAGHLWNRCSQLGDIADIEEGIVLSREALDLCPSEHPNRLLVSGTVALCLSGRFSQLGGMEDLNEAISLGRQALELCPPGHPYHSLSLNSLSNYVADRYNVLGEIRDLNEAIILGRQALELCPPGHSGRSWSLDNVAEYLQCRYTVLGAMSDLDEAIILGRQSLELCPPGHPCRSSSLNRVANCVATRYNVLGEMTDLNEAIILARQALELCLPGHSGRSWSLNCVAKYLASRYNVLGEITDLNEAIILGRGALELCSFGHPNRSLLLSNLADYIINRYNVRGEMEDLNEAIALARQALELCPPGNPARSSLLNNVAKYLTVRCNVLVEMTELSEVITFGRQALELCPPGHPDRSLSLNSLAIFLNNRYNVTGEMTDLNQAISLSRQALELCPPGHPQRPGSLNSVAGYLAGRYNVLREMTDLNEAIILAKQALELCPLGHPKHPWLLNSVARYLADRHDMLGEITDLNEAIILGQRALELHPPGHTNRSFSLDTLAHSLRIRFILLNDPKDREDSFSLYTQLTNLSQIMSHMDLHAAKQWVSSAEFFCHPTMLIAYETSLRLLVQHLSTLPSLPRHLHTYKYFASSLAIDAFSACLRNSSPKKAVEMLEHGRGLFWNQIARLRSPLDDVIASGQKGAILADEFARLASEIQNTIHSSRDEDQHNRLCDLNVNLLSTIAKIRTLPGLAYFLLPSSFSYLQQAASGGPVVIVNASQYTCDALVVFVDKDPFHIPLQITKDRVQGLSLELGLLTSRAKWEDVRSGFGRFLRDLWNEVVSPIVDILRVTVPIGSRIWWCPTSEFSFLPLHAAGPYRRGQQNLSHLYVSSYTPTLTALIRARREDIFREPLSSGHRFLAVGEAHANGESQLLFVGTELDIVVDRMKCSATLTRLEGPDSSISRVSEEIRKSEWVHFACHGVPNKEEPFESGFALHDGRLTIQRIMGYQLEHSQFAYLSACHTTVGAKENPDEVIHLASAMQFAGFRSVIGTMWAVDDEQTNKIVSMFYRHMVDGSGELDYTRAAFAVNQTMKMLPEIPFDQRILYVHIGA